MGRVLIQPGGQGGVRLRIERSFVHAQHPLNRRLPNGIVLARISHPNKYDAREAGTLVIAA